MLLPGASNRRRRNPSSRSVSSTTNESAQSENSGQRRNEEETGRKGFFFVLKFHFDIIFYYKVREDRNFRIFDLKKTVLFWKWMKPKELVYSGSQSDKSRNRRDSTPLTSGIDHPSSSNANTPNSVSGKAQNGGGGRQKVDTRILIDLKFRSPTIKCTTF